LPLARVFHIAQQFARAPFCPDADLAAFALGFDVQGVRVDVAGSARGGWPRRRDIRLDSVPKVE